MAKENSKVAMKELMIEEVEEPLIKKPKVTKRSLGKWKGKK